MASEPTVDEQITELARRYSQRAAAYHSLWSPAIQPIGERLLERLPLAGAEHVIECRDGRGCVVAGDPASGTRAVILGIDRSEGMLKLARQRHDGPLALMDAQSLDLPDGRFDVALLAFVLFHLPDPDQCLHEVFRVLKPGGRVGAATWSVENFAAANMIWDEELSAAGAATFQLPATDNRACCNSEAKMTRLLERAGFSEIRTWSESLEHRWRPEDHFDYQVRSTSRLRLESLALGDRDECVRQVRARLATASEEQYVFRGEVVMTTAARPDGPDEQHPGRRPEMETGGMEPGKPLRPSQS